MAIIESKTEMPLSYSSLSPTIFFAKSDFKTSSTFLKASFRSELPLFLPKYSINNAVVSDFPVPDMPAAVCVKVIALLTSEASFASCDALSGFLGSKPLE
ncbi:MAG: hypothetical protein ACXAAH_06730 [Promethearchaeota archaeon]